MRRRRRKTLRETSNDGRSPGFTCDQGTDYQTTNATKNIVTTSKERAIGS
jgi:hypothetical protein